jgi:hypothetical protein
MAKGKKHDAEFQRKSPLRSYQVTERAWSEHKHTISSDEMYMTGFYQFTLRSAIDGYCMHKFHLSDARWVYRGKML